MFVPFEKVISLPTLVLGSPVQLVVAERKTRGGSGRGAGLVPSMAQPGRVPVSSWLWEYPIFMLKMHPLGTQPELHLWSIPGSVLSAWHSWDMGRVLLALGSSRVSQL